MQQQPPLAYTIYCFHWLDLSLRGAQRPLAATLQIKDHCRLSEINRAHVNTTSARYDITSICHRVTFPVISLEKRRLWNALIVTNLTQGQRQVVIESEGAEMLTEHRLLLWIMISCRQAMKSIRSKVIRASNQQPYEEQVLCHPDTSFCWHTAT